MRSSRFTIRSATELDRPAILRINKVSFEQPFTENWYDGLQADPDKAVLVAECGAQVVGFLIYYLRPEGVYVFYLAVAEQFRSMGVGSCLLEYLDEQLPALGKQQVRLHVSAENKGALAFYERNDFRPVAEMANLYGDGRRGLLLLHQGVKS